MAPFATATMGPFLFLPPKPNNKQNKIEEAVSGFVAQLYLRNNFSGIECWDVEMQCGSPILTVGYLSEEGFEFRSQVKEGREIDNYVSFRRERKRRSKDQVDTDDLEESGDEKEEEEDYIEKRRKPEEEFTLQLRNVGEVSIAISDILIDGISSRGRDLYRVFHRLLLPPPALKLTSSSSFTLEAKGSINLVFKANWKDCSARTQSQSIQFLPSSRFLSSLGLLVDIVFSLPQSEIQSCFEERGSSSKEIWVVALAHVVILSAFILLVLLTLRIRKHGGLNGSKDRKGSDLQRNSVLETSSKEGNGEEDDDSNAFCLSAGQTTHSEDEEDEEDRPEEIAMHEDDDNHSLVVEDDNNVVIITASESSEEHMPPMVMMNGTSLDSPASRTYAGETEAKDLQSPLSKQHSFSVSSPSSLMPPDCQPMAEDFNVFRHPSPFPQLQQQPIQAHSSSSSGSSRLSPQGGHARERRTTLEEGAHSILQDLAWTTNSMAASMASTPIGHAHLHPRTTTSSFASSSLFSHDSYFSPSTSLPPHSNEFSAHSGSFVDYRGVGNALPSAWSQAMQLTQPLEWSPVSDPLLEDTLPAAASSSTGDTMFRQSFSPPGFPSSAQTSLAAPPGLPSQPRFQFHVSEAANSGNGGNLTSFLPLGSAPAGLARRENVRDELYELIAEPHLSGKASSFPRRKK